MKSDVTESVGERRFLRFKRQLKNFILNFVDKKLSNLLGNEKWENLFQEIAATSSSNYRSCNVL